MLKSIPILMYHSISNDNNKMSVSVKNFEEQMIFMKENDYESINLKDLSTSNKKKTFVITFDDGYEDVFYNAMPLLKKFNFKATCFFVSDLIGQYNYWDEVLNNYKKIKLMNKEQVYKWLTNGFEAGAHSSNHKNLTLLGYEEKIKEITEPKKYFNENFKCNVKSFSYPYGLFDSETSKIVSNHYNFAVTTKSWRYTPNKFNYLSLPRVPVNRKDGSFKFFLKIRTIYEDLKY